MVDNVGQLSHGGLIGNEREPLAELLALTLPGAVSFLDRFSDLTLGEISQGFHHRDKNPSEVLIKAAELLAERLGDEPAASRVSEALKAGYPILAANHHGLETHPEMVQGALLFGLKGLLDQSGQPVITLASSTVPLTTPPPLGGSHRVAAGLTVAEARPDCSADRWITS